MKNKRIQAIFICVSVIMSMLTVFAAEYNPDPYTEVRVRPALKENQYTIAFIGGSLTEGGKTWIDKTVECVEETLNGREVVAINAGKGGTGSNYGSARFMNDVGSFAPDMVVIEFAVNDRGRVELESKVHMECMVRQCLSLPKVPAVLFVYAPMPVEEGYEKYQMMLNQYAWKEEIAAHYGIKSINIYDYMQEDFKDGQKFSSFDEYLASMYSKLNSGEYDTHGGYEKYAEAIEKAFSEDAEACMAKPKNTAIYCKESVDFADARHRYIECDDSKITYDDKWQHYDVNNQYKTGDENLKITEKQYSYPYFENGIMQTESNGSFSFESSADAFCINYPAAKVGSSVTVYVDGTALEEKPSCWAAAQSYNYNSIWCELPKDGNPHEISVVVDEPTDTNYVFRFGNIIERYKYKTPEPAVDNTQNETEDKDNSADVGGNNDVAQPETPAEELVGNIKEFYISLEGSDTNDGTFQKPFQTIDAAKDAVKKFKETKAFEKCEGICVYIRGGQYGTLKTIQFSASDSGTATCPITYRNYPGEEVSFTGGVKIEVSDFKKVSEEKILNRIRDERARDFIYQYDLSGIKGLTMSDKGTNAMICDGKEMSMARYPNVDEEGRAQNIMAGELVSDNVGENGDWIYTLEPAHADIVKSWSKVECAGGATLEGPLTTAWYKDTLPIINITNGAIRTKKPSYPTWRPEQSSFYITNILAELDQPGEYYIDQNRQMLYMFPTVDSDTNSDLFICNEMTSLFNISASNIRFSGISVNGVTGQGVVINGSNVIYEYSEVKNISDCGITLNANARNCIIRGNYLFNLVGGIRCKAGNKDTLEPGKCIIENNEVERFSKFGGTYVPGIEISKAIECVARNNKIHDAKHQAVGVSGLNNVFEYNEIFNVCNDTEDAGAMYTGRNASEWGNELNNNYFHDLLVNEKYKHATFGIRTMYFDDHQYGYTAKNNLMVNIEGYGIYINGGSYFNIKNNIGVNVDKAVTVAGSGPRSGDSNQVLNDETVKTVTWFDKFATQYFPIDLLAEQFPQVKTIWGSQVYLPKENYFENNISINSGGAVTNTELNGNKAANVSGNLDNYDPEELFVDYKNGDYRIKPDSKIYQDSPGFEDIHFEKMGMYSEKAFARLSDSIVLSVDNCGSFVNGEYKLVDSNNIHFSPVIMNNRTMIPVRFVSEALDAEVTWNGEEKSVEVKKGNKIIKITIGSDKMLVNGTAVALDSPAVIKDNRTLLPMRALCEALEKQVYWNDLGLIVIGNSSNVFNEEEVHMVEDIIARLSTH